MSLFRRTKNNDKMIIRQILNFIPNYIANQSIIKYQSDKYCHKHKTKDQYIFLLLIIKILIKKSICF